MDCRDVNFKYQRNKNYCQTIIKINGNKELVSKIAADIKNFKPVRYIKQKVLRKEVNLF